MQWLVAPLSAEIVQRVSDYESIVGRKDFIKNVFNNERAAERRAEKEAAAHPGVQYALFGIVKIFETTKPKVVVKVLNAQNEVVLAPAEPVSS